MRKFVACCGLLRVAVGPHVKVALRLITVWTADPSLRARVFGQSRALWGDSSASRLITGRSDMPSLCDVAVYYSKWGTPAPSLRGGLLPFLPFLTVLEPGLPRDARPCRGRLLPFQGEGPSRFISKIEAYIVLNYLVNGLWQNHFERGRFPAYYKLCHVRRCGLLPFCPGRASCGRIAAYYGILVCAGGMTWRLSAVGAVLAWRIITYTQCRVPWRHRMLSSCRVGVPDACDGGLASVDSPLALAWLWAAIFEYMHTYRYAYKRVSVLHG